MSDVRVDLCELIAVWSGLVKTKIHQQMGHSFLFKVALTPLYDK